MKVMSYNVHLKEDSDLKGKEYSWDYRKVNIAKIIQSRDIDIIGFQEPFLKQVMDLDMLLNDYSWYGVGLEDGKEKGPYNAIFYKHSRFRLLQESSFYLSSTPAIPSKGWDGKFPRGVSFVKLEDKKLNRVFYVFNTHFDYHGQIARDESAYLLKEKIFEISKKHPFILTGDFNLFPDLGGKQTYFILTKKDGDMVLFDALHKTLFPHLGPTGTWSGYKEAGQPGIKPDCIFVSKDITVISHAILSDTFEGNFPSDHLPVLAELEFSTLC